MSLETKLADKYLKKLKATGVKITYLQEVEIRSGLVNCIRESYNEGLEDAADNAKVENIPTYEITSDSIDKQSILKLKK